MPAKPTWKLGWDYDRFGNRKNQNVLAGSAPAPQLSIDETTNRINDPGYSYDPAGNLTDDAQNTMTYDAENRIASLQPDGSTTSYDYEYDGSFLRVKKLSTQPVMDAPPIVITTYSVYSGSKVIAEYVVGGSNLILDWKGQHGCEVRTCNTGIGKPVFIGSQFMTLSLSGMATVVIHEFVHQALSVYDPIPYNDAHIAAACGTGIP